jgi:integrase
MRYRQKPNGMWVIDYDDNGTRKRISTGIKTAPMKAPPADVKAAGREIVLGIRTPQTVAPSAAGQARKRDGRLTMLDLFDQCMKTVWHPDNVRAQKSVISNVKVLNAMIGEVAVEDMTFSRLEQLVTDMKAKGYEPATIKRKLAMVSKALRMATKWSGDDGRPLLVYKPEMPTVVVNNIKERIISPLEESALFAALEKRRQTEPGRQWFRFRAFLSFLFATGGRVGETIGLGPQNLKELNGTTYVTFPRYRTKSGKPRTVPLTPAAVDALDSLRDQLVLDKATGEWTFFGFTGALAWQMFAQLRDDVAQETGMDLSEATLHTIRHTVLTRLAQGGMGLAQLQVWAGHSDPKITASRYIHLMPSDLLGALSILNGTDGSSGAISARSRTKPVIVPDTIGEAIGASGGTPAVH